MKNRIIACAGTAGVGKNLFCTVLQNELNKLGFSSTILAFADTLKKDCQKEILEKYNIDILKCSREDKEKVRHILVERATENRIKDPDYYVKLLEKELYNWDVDFVLISDTRYPNEAKFAQNDGGIVVYLSLYEYIDRKAIFLAPANETEMWTCAEVRRIADYDLAWQKRPELYKDGYTHEEWVLFFIQQFIRYYTIHDPQIFDK